MEKMSSEALAWSRDRKHSCSHSVEHTKSSPHPQVLCVSHGLPDLGGAQSQSQSQVIFSRERAASLLVLSVEKAVPGLGRVQAVPLACQMLLFASSSTPRSAGFTSGTPVSLSLLS